MRFFKNDCVIDRAEGILLRERQMHWKTQAQPRAPLALAAAAIACGIWLSGHMQSSAALWGCAGLLLPLCSIAAVAIGSAPLARVPAVLALICAGAFVRLATPLPHTVIPPSELLSGEPVEIVGYVTNDSVLRAGGGPRERFDVQTELIELGQLKFPGAVGVRATVFSREAGEEDPNLDAGPFPRLAYGTRLRFKARLRLPRNFGNPGAFDYEGYLRGIGVSALASVKLE